MIDRLAARACPCEHDECQKCLQHLPWLVLAGSPAMRARLLRSAGSTHLQSSTRLPKQSDSQAKQSLVLLRGSATSATSEAFESAKAAGESGSNASNRKRFGLYPAAAAVALTSLAAATVHQQPQFQEDKSQSALLDAPWVQQIPQQHSVLQVLSAESIDTHPLLKQDHIVSLRTGPFGAKWHSNSSNVTHPCSCCSSQSLSRMVRSGTWCVSMILHIESTIMPCS